MCQLLGINLEDCLSTCSFSGTNSLDGALSFCKEFDRPDGFSFLNTDGDVVDNTSSYGGGAMSDDSPFVFPLSPRNLLDVPVSSDQMMDKYEHEQDQIQGNEEPPACLEQLARAEEQQKGTNSSQMVSKAVYSKEVPPEARLDFYKDCLSRWLASPPPQSIKSDEVFQEIMSKGCQGSSKKMQTFLTRVSSQNRPPEAYLKFHEAYLIKRAADHCFDAQAAGAAFFGEIQKKGRQGSMGNVHTFPSKIHEEKDTDCYPDSSLGKHRDSPIEGTGTPLPLRISATQLFKEIQVEGYQGSLRNVQIFMQRVWQQIESSLSYKLEFHKKYLISRLQETHPHRLSASTLFEEIKMRGYRGSLKAIQTFLTAARLSRNSVSIESDLCFHRRYLLKRVEETQLRPLSASALFEEIKTRGYRGSFKDVQDFLKSVGYEKLPSKEDVEFHTDYLIRRIEEVPNPLKVSEFVLQLFGEIRNKGYRGTVKKVEVLVRKIRRRGRSRSRYLLPEASLAFHKNYLNKRLKKDSSCLLSSKKLFAEIKKQGYRGTLKSVQKFVTIIRKSEYTPESYLSFHKSYLIERLQKACPRYIPGALLFREIKAKGYQGTLKNVYAFLSGARAMIPNCPSGIPKN